MAKSRRARETSPPWSSQRRSWRKSHRDGANRAIALNRSRARSPSPCDQHQQLASFWRGIYESMDYASHKPSRHRSRSNSRTPEHRASSPVPLLSRPRSPPKLTLTGYEPHSPPYTPVWSCGHSPGTSPQAPRLTRSPNNLLRSTAQQYSPAHSPNSPVYSPVLYTPATPRRRSPDNSPIHSPAPAEPQSPPASPYFSASIQYSPQNAMEHSPNSPGSPQLTLRYPDSPSSPYASSPYPSPPTSPAYQHSPTSAPFSPDFSLSPYSARSPSYSPPPPPPSALRQKSVSCVLTPLPCHLAPQPHRSGIEVLCMSPVHRSSDPQCMSEGLLQSLLKVLSVNNAVAGGEASGSREYIENTVAEEEEVEDFNDNGNNDNDDEDEGKDEDNAEQDDQEALEEDIGDEDSKDGQEEEGEEDQEEDENEDAVLVKNEEEEHVEEDVNDEEAEEQLEPEFEQQAKVKQEEQHVDTAPGTSQSGRASAELEGPITEDMVREVLQLHQARIVALKSAREKWTAAAIYDEARRALRAEGLLVNQQKRIGEIPGIPVGMVFRTYMEMQCVGMKYMPRAGIDMMEYGGIKVSPIIVMVGQYRNLDQGETVQYMGQQVQDKDGLPLKDAPLSGGNQALVNSNALGVPVRLVRRVQEGYMYSGLYTVANWQYIQNGANQSIEFRLTRLPDQAPLPDGMVEYAGTRVTKRKRDKKPADAQLQNKPKVLHADHTTPDMDAAAMDSVPPFSSPVTATAIDPSQPSSDMQISGPTAHATQHANRASSAGAASVAGTSQGRASHADTQRQLQQDSPSDANRQSLRPSFNPKHQAGQVASWRTTSHAGSPRLQYGETSAFAANRQSQPSLSQQPAVSSTPLNSLQQTDTQRQSDQHPPVHPHASMSVPRARPADALKATQTTAQTDPVPERVSSRLEQVGASVSCNLEAGLRIVAVRETWMCPSADCGSPGVVVELASEKEVLNARLRCGKCGKRMMRAGVELD